MKTQLMGPEVTMNLRCVTRRERGTALGLQLTRRGGDSIDVKFLILWRILQPQYTGILCWTRI